MSEVCKTCGIIAGTHACNPLHINMKNMRLTIQNQQSEITRLNYLVASLKKTIEIMQDIIDTEKLKGVE